MKRLKTFMSSILPGCFVFFVILSCCSVYAGENLSFNAYTDKTGYSQGDTLRIHIKTEIESGYHMYSNPKGPGIGKPLVITPSSSGDIRWISGKKSRPEKYNPDIGKWVWAYEDKADFLIKGVVQGSAGSTKAEITINFNGLTCSSSCIPFDKDVKLNTIIGKTGRENPVFPDTEAGYLPVDLNLSSGMEDSEYNEGSVSLELSMDKQGKRLKTGPDPFEMPKTTEPVSSVDPEQGINNKDSLADTVNSGAKTRGTGALFEPLSYSPVENKREFNIIIAVLFAFIAGLILNLMPCVLPVLGLKILSFSRGREKSKGEAVKSSLIFSAGMISVYLLLAALASFAGYSWGEQFRTPSNLMLIIAAIVVFSLGMFDVYTLILPSSIANKESQVNRNQGIVSEFMRGMFATVLATPCSGPFLGATLAWTLSQPAYIIYLVYISLGVGMASPYIILSASDRARKVVPKPGKWMDDLKHLMGFLLLGFAVYLASGLPAKHLIPTLWFSLILSFAASLFKRFAPFGSSPVRRLIVWGVAILIAIGGWYSAIHVVKGLYTPEKSTKGDYTWKSFSYERLRQAHERGEDVLVDFTADWCMNCKYNEVTVYRSREIERLLQKKDVLFLKADLTGSNPEAEKLMSELGSESVPFMALFKGDDPARPVVIRDIVSKRKLRGILKSLDRGD